MLAEIRIESLGAISTATAEFDRGLTVLTGETGTGKTMVVTGLHLLGGARADATRVRSGADRAVVEGRFTTTDLDDATGAELDAILDASGAERDEDGSVIALRSVSRDGPSRAYLGGRSVPAKSLSGFTTELLTQVLTEPKNSLIKQYTELFALSDVELRPGDLEQADPHPTHAHGTPTLCQPPRTSNASEASESNAPS